MLAAGEASAVAFCALRDPVETIYSLFPEADGYRSNVQTIDNSARESVRRDTGLELHFNELGRHTLYVVQIGSRTIGFVHARTEVGAWGLVEYAWAINPDQTIRDVVVQRARDPALLQSGVVDRIRAEIVGRDIGELRAAYAQLDANDTGQPLFASLLRSAIKTLSVTGHAWTAEFAQAP